MRSCMRMKRYHLFKLILFFVLAAGGHVSAAISQTDDAHIPVTSGSAAILLVVGILGYSLLRRK